MSDVMIIVGVILTGVITVPLILIAALVEIAEFHKDGTKPPTKEEWYDDQG